MNENLDKLIIEATKFLKIARFILILWIAIHILQLGAVGIGIFGLGMTPMKQQPAMMAE